MKGYKRLGGAGIAKPLWECETCGSAVSNTDVHDAWHRNPTTPPHLRNLRD